MKKSEVYDWIWIFGCFAWMIIGESILTPPTSHVSSILVIFTMVVGLVITDAYRKITNPLAYLNQEERESEVHKTFKPTSNQCGVCGAPLKDGECEYCKMTKKRMVR